MCEFPIYYPNPRPGEVHSGGLGSTSGIQTLIAFQHQPLSAGSWVPVVECDFWHWHVCGCLKLIILCVHHAREH